MEEMKLRELNPEGGKIDYSRVRKTILQCELDRNSLECKKALRELGIREV